MFIDPSTIYSFSPLMGDRNIALLTELTKLLLPRGQIGLVLPMRGSKIFPRLSRNVATFANGQEEFVA